MGNELGDRIMLELLTKQQAADYLGVQVCTLDYWHRQGRLPWIKLSRNCVRIAMVDLQAFIENSRERLKHEALDS
jgi:excisionase family DNA binding protein